MFAFLGDVGGMMMCQMEYPMHVCRLPNSRVNDNVV